MTRAIADDAASAGAIPKPRLALRLAWRFTRRVMLYLKAAGSLILLAGGTFTSQYQLVDVQGVIRTLFGSSARLGTIIAAVTISYLALTVALKLPKGFSANVKMNDGE